MVTEVQRLTFQATLVFQVGHSTLVRITARAQQKELQLLTSLEILLKPEDP